MALVAGCSGGGSGGAETPEPVDLSACTTHMLPYGVNDAAYSDALGRIVALSLNAVHLLDPVTLDSTSIALPMIADSMSLAPDGRSAAVSHDHALSIVDLAKQTVTATIPTNSGAGDVVMAANGFAYFVPRSLEDADLHSVEIRTAVDHGMDDAPNTPYHNDTFIKLHPSGTSIYGIDHLSTSDLVRNDISAGVSMNTYRGADSFDHNICGDLWIAPDGGDIYTGCGAVFRAAPGTKDDMTYRTAFGAIPNADPKDILFEALTFDPPHDRIYAVVGNQSKRIPELWDLEGRLRTFSYQTLSLLSTKALPCMAVESTKQDAKGRFVLTPAGGSKIFVIAESILGGPAGVVVFDRE
jgi:hypothetical protein